jgi:hypothetical protein
LSLTQSLGNDDVLQHCPKAEHRLQQMTYMLRANSRYAAEETVDALRAPEFEAESDAAVFDVFGRSGHSGKAIIAAR